jgi:hypothetical protein
MQKRITMNHNMTIRTSDEMDALRPFGVICMLVLSEVQKTWLAANGITVRSDYEGLRFARGRSSVKVRPRTDGGANVTYYYPSEFRAGCWSGRSEPRSTVKEALAELVRASS